jgi:hypothetical protein
MTEANKAHTRSLINDMQPDSMTNLWSGIRKGLGLFDPKEKSEAANSNIPALMVLTDGLPNHMSALPGPPFPLLPLTIVLGSRRAATSRRSAVCCRFGPSSTPSGLDTISCPGF